MEKKLKGIILKALRRGFYISGLYNKVLQKFRLRRGVYKCEICKEETARKDVNVDHIIPVGLSDDWNHIIHKMFDIENCQVLCIPCHKIKTKQDIKQIRKKNANKDTSKPSK